MAKKVLQKKSLGAWAFLVGVLLAVVLGLFSGPLGAQATNVIIIVLVLIGIVVGLLNVGGAETNKFLIAALALVIASALGASAASQIRLLSDLLDAILLLVVPATIIVALRSVFVIAKD